MISRAVEVGCLVIRPRRMATATAMAECEIMRLEKAAVPHLASEQPRGIFLGGTHREVARRLMARSGHSSWRPAQQLSGVKRKLQFGRAAAAILSLHRLYFGPELLPWWARRGVSASASTNR